MRNMVSFRLLLLVVALSISIFSLNTFVVLPEAVVSNQPQQLLLQSASATFPGENGKIAFSSNHEIYVINADGSNPTRLTNHPPPDLFPDWSPDGTKIAFGSAREGENFEEIYVMNADGSGQTRLTNNPTVDYSPDWGPATATEPPEDTTAPVLTVPENIFAEATSTNGGTEVTFTITAEDDVDGSATLEEDGTTIKQDDIGGNITMSCDPASGSEFPIGDTTVQCTATDLAGNEGTVSFMVTVNPPPPTPDTTPLTLTVPEDMTVQATTTNGGTVVTYAISAEDNVDGTATLEEDNIAIQDEIGGDINISCDPASGSEFPVDATVVECTTTDAAGNIGGPATFTVTVLPPQPEPDPLTAEISSSDIEGIAPATFEFEAIAAGGTQPYTYSWDFGDGSTEEESIEPTTSHLNR